MKKIFIIFSLLSLLLVIPGCAKKPMMDKLNEAGFYPYSNDELGFSLSLPKEFEYYQTQRTSFTNYTDLDIFVPTADTNYPEQIPGYAEPIIVRVYDKPAYDALSASTSAMMVKAAERKGKVYSLIFWASAPSDWQGKWSDAMKQQLIDNFKLK
jgi:hypothetical protein